MAFKQTVLSIIGVMMVTTPLYGAQDANRPAKTKLAVNVTKKPVTPNASPEAVKLLEYLYSISGKQTLVGQHCAPLVVTTQLPLIEKWTGHYPALCGFDFGFSAPGT